LTRYYFAARVGDLLAEDDEGLEFPNPAAARRHAVSIAGELADSEFAVDGSGPEIVVEIVDDKARPVFGIELTPATPLATAIANA